MPADRTRPPVRPAFLLLASTFVAAVLLASPAGAQHVSYEKYRLDNGLTVILHEDHSLPVVCINTWFHVGAKDEREGRSGFAHLFEHLMFMGTERVPGSDYDILMEEGGGWNNASTGWDRTNYFSFGPKSLLATLLWLDADRLEDLGRMMDQEKLDKQRDVVRNERREGVEMEPYGSAEFEISQLMYPADHPYHYDVIGTHEDLQAASVKDVKDFFATYYVPNNASLVVAGDIDPVETKALVQRYFGSIPRSADPLHAEALPVTLGETKRATFYDQVQFPRLYYVWHSPAHHQAGDAEMDLAAQVLGSGKSSRLYKRLVVEEELATSVMAYQASGALGSLFYVIITARPDVALETIEPVADAVIREFVERGPEKTELERQKTGWESQMLQGLQSVLRKADQLNAYEYAFGEPDSFERDLDRYRKGTPRAVREWAGKVLRPDERLIVKVLPEEGVDPRADRDERPATPAEAAAFDVPAPERFTLGNGIEVEHWRRSELPLVEVSFRLGAGAAGMDGGHAGCASLTADMLDEGTAKLDAFEFADALDLLGAGFSAGSGVETTVISLSSLKRTFPEALALAVDAIRDPRLADEDWDRVKRLHLERLRQAEDRPETVARRVAMRAYFGEDHPYGRPVAGTIESVEAMDLAEVRAAHAKYYGPGNLKIFTAGDLTADEAKKLLEKAIGGWTDPEGFVPAPQVEGGAPANDGLRVVMVEKPDAVQTVIRFTMPGPLYSDPNRVDYELLNTILGGSFTSRLNGNLREEHGYTYGARSGYVMTPSTGYLTASSTVQAEVTGAALDEFLYEFRRLRDGDVTAEEARKARETNRMDAIQSFEGLGGLLATAVRLELNGLPLSAISNDLAAITKVDEGDLNGLARAAVPLESALLVLVGDRDTILEQIAGKDLPAVEEWTVKGEPKE